MKSVTYIIIRAEENDVKVVTSKNNDETLEILQQGEVLILNLQENITNYKVKGKATIVSELNQVISG